jgi:hypothetical protein
MSTGRIMMLDGEAGVPRLKDWRLRGGGLSRNAMLTPKMVQVLLQAVVEIGKRAIAVRQNRNARGPLMMMVMPQDWFVVSSSNFCPHLNVVLGASHAYR